MAGGNIMKKYPYAGIIRGNDSRVPLGAKQAVRLRETKHYWISDTDVRYKKPNGRGPGRSPVFDLDISTIYKIEG